MKEPVSIYIHIPFCRKKCYYCDFTSVCDIGGQDGYIGALQKEMAFYRDRLEGRPVRSVFIGGGTPSVLDVGNINAVFRSLDGFAVGADCEITVEGNPESLTAEKLSCFKDNGVNRLSIGLQSVNDKSLKAIGRLHTYDDFLHCLDRAVSLFDNINADVMIGVDASFDEFAHTVNTVVQLPLSHISCYALEVYPNSLLRQLIDGGTVTVTEDEDALADMYDYALDAFRRNGFDRYEISNFAKKDRQCIHNLNYWKCGDYVGLGVAAAGYLDGVRYTNTRSLDEYLSGITVKEKQIIDKNESMKEYLMLGLRLEEGVSLSEFYRRYGIPLTEAFDISCRADCLDLSDDRLAVRKDKFYALNYILSDLL